MEKARILIIEDNQGLAELLAEEIADFGFTARWASRAAEAHPLLDSWRPDLVICDLRLPDIDGIDFLQTVKSRPLPPAFLIITAFGTVSKAVEALKAGADDFLTKPLDLEHLEQRIRRLIEFRGLRRQVEGLRKSFLENTFHGIYGQSAVMHRLFEQIAQIAPAAGPVLILGESGSGKELVARAIHACSTRANAPFVAVNCAGIPENLIESEFFGHAPGAFTGARTRRDGLFQEAEGGTLLLDEIAEMPLALQTKLLRILQDGQVRPVGGNQEHQVDVRVLAATHQNLEKTVGEGKLREDLFYRLETFTLRIPPLRERGEDIELLANRFLSQFAGQMRKPAKKLSTAALERIVNYSFPGNVRELKNAMERAVTFCHESTIRSEHLPARLRRDPGQTGDATDRPDRGIFDGNPPPTLDQVERRYVTKVLEQVQGNKKKAADLLGISRKTLYRKLASGTNH